MDTVPAHPSGGNPKAGLIFERVIEDNPSGFFRAVLNDDLTVTVQDTQTERTFCVDVLYSLGTLQAWAARCHFGELGLTPGPVGLRMASYYARHERQLAVSA